MIFVGKKISQKKYICPPKKFRSKIILAPGIFLPKNKFLHPKIFFAPRKILPKKGFVWLYFEITKPKFSKQIFSFKEGCQSQFPAIFMREWLELYC